MSSPTAQTGRAKTLLVFGDGDGARAVISTVVVRTRDEGRDASVRFTGPVAFEESSVRHLSETVLPMIDRIVAALALPRSALEISIANIGAASATDLGSRISGFSADIPVLLAGLSAVLQLPVPEDMVATGHVASPDGDIAMVKAIPAKVAAAMADSSIRRFVHPVVERDTSLQMLSPNTVRQVLEAIASARGRLQTIAVGDVVDLLRAVFDDQAVVLASLRQGFFAAPGVPRESAGSITEAIRFLADNNEGRFWAALESLLLAGQDRCGSGALDGSPALPGRPTSVPQRSWCSIASVGSIVTAGNPPNQNELTADSYGGMHRDQPVCHGSRP